MNMFRVGLLFTFVLLLSVGCERPDPTGDEGDETAVYPTIASSVNAPQGETAVSNETSPIAPTITRPSYDGVPTPDAPHVAVNGDDQPFQIHTISSGDTLGYLAQLYGSSVEELLAANNLGVTDILYIGQEIQIPVQASIVGSSFKLIPDSELMYGEAAKGFSINAIINQYDGYLRNYREEVEGVQLDGAGVINLVAHRFSVSPRLLLAALEHRAGWVTQANPAITHHPMGNGAGGDGLYSQLGWAANLLNLGYYGRSEGGVSSILIDDGTRVAIAPDINDGTAGVQLWLAAHDGATYDGWVQDSGGDGFFGTYNRLFGNPFAFTIAPVLPNGLTQPPLQLPWMGDSPWYYTSGPHGGWAPGSAWAALDFVPEGDALGCVQSDDWVTAMADGVVTRSDFGAVVVDLDGNGYAGDGWALLYMHLESRDRIAVGSIVQTGDQLGHPSCEGGYSDGTHVHVARLYNGRWIAADGAIPFEMSGWVSSGAGREYDGFLTRGDTVREAWVGIREEINRVDR